VIVIGPPARNVSEADAAHTSSASHRQRTSPRATAGALEPVDARKARDGSA